MNSLAKLDCAIPVPKMPGIVKSPKGILKTVVLAAAALASLGLGAAQAQNLIGEPFSVSGPALDRSRKRAGRERGGLYIDQ
jgi:hypothetical protein